MSWHYCWYKNDLKAKMNIITHETLRISLVINLAVSYSLQYRHCSELVEH
jgi:hypothetical protein